MGALALGIDLGTTAVKAMVLDDAGTPLALGSAPTRLITVSCMTISRSVPGYILPPIEEYSPSVFSRTIIISMSPGFLLASGRGTPGMARAGRRLTY